MYTEKRGCWETALRENDAREGKLKIKIVKNTIKTKVTFILYLLHLFIFQTFRDASTITL